MYVGQELRKIIWIWVLKSVDKAGEDYMKLSMAEIIQEQCQKKPIITRRLMEKSLRNAYFHRMKTKRTMKSLRRNSWTGVNF